MSSRIPWAEDFRVQIDKLLNGSTSNSKPSDFLGIEPSTIPIIEPSNTSNDNGTIIYTDPSVSSGILEAQNVDSKPNSHITKCKFCSIRK